MKIKKSRARNEQKEVRNRSRKESGCRKEKEKKVRNREPKWNRQLVEH